MLRHSVRTPWGVYGKASSNRRLPPCQGCVSALESRPAPRCDICTIDHLKRCQFGRIAVDWILLLG